VGRNSHVAEKKQEIETEIINATQSKEYEKYLYRCLAPIPFRKYRTRNEYLLRAIPQGFRKELLLFGKQVVGEIEYAPANASGYPITGASVIVMNCIWVLRRAKGHSFGNLLIARTARQAEKIGVMCLATLGLENHWSGWLRKDQMEMLGFKSIDAVTVTHKTKHVVEPFTIHLMSMPIRTSSTSTTQVCTPRWDKSRLLEGVTFCIAHPLYHPQKLKNQKQIMRIVEAGK
jgi:hypothetical protein